MEEREVWAHRETGERVRVVKTWEDAGRQVVRLRALDGQRLFFSPEAREGTFVAEVGFIEARYERVEE